MTPATPISPLSAIPVAFAIGRRHIDSSMMSFASPTHPIRTWRCSASPAAVLIGMLLLAACTPTIKLQAPDEPIVINLNVKIEQEIRVKVEREIDQLIREEKGVF